VVFDGRNIYDPAMVEAAGIAYYGVGRGRSCRSSALTAPASAASAAASATGA
jgi:hypothetical protein